VLVLVRCTRGLGLPAMVGTAVSCAAAVMVVAVVGLARGAFGASVQLGPGIDV
jgi:hypothetical protein